MSRDILKRLSEPGLVALCVPGEEWPRALLGETPIPDAWMGLVLLHDGRRRFVPAGEDPGCNRDDRLVLVRNRRLTVPLQAVGTRASCGNVVDGQADVLVYWGAREDDLAALERTLLASGTLTQPALAVALADAGAWQALQRLIRATPAAELVGQDLRETFASALREDLKRFFFETGLNFDRVATLAFTSATLAQRETLERAAAQRVEQIRARELVEQAALAATRRRLDDLTIVLDKLRSAADADSGRRWHELLPALAPAERGKLLANLWRITPNRVTLQAICAVVGLDCVWLDPAAPETLLRRVPLPADLGGLRSVAYHADTKLLLVGAARGVWTVSSESGEVLAKYEVPGAESPRMGFNAATIAPTGGAGSAAPPELWLWGTHSQLGCWRWRLDQPHMAECVLAPINGVPRTVRAAMALADGRVAIAADDTVQVYEPSGARTDVTPALSAPPALGGALGSREQPLQRGSSFLGGSMQPSQVFDAVPAAIQALAVLDDDVFVGTSNGLLLQRKLGAADTAPGAPGMWAVVYRAATPIETIQVRRWNDLIELVVPSGPQGVCGVFPEEGVVTSLLAAPLVLRRAWACDDAIVALNDRRDRLVIATAQTPERAGRDVSVARLLGELVQDLCLITRGSERGNPGGAPAPESAA